MSTDDIQNLFTELAPTLSTWVLRVAGALVAFMVARWAAKLIAGAFRKFGERTNMDATLLAFLTVLVRWGVLVLSVVAILGIFGIQTASFAAAIGAAGLAIGLAFQGSLSNVASGVMLLLFRPFSVGNVVKIGGETGTIVSIELMTTKLDTFDNRRLMVPNSAVFNSTIENISFHDIRRADLSIGVDYGSDLDKVREVLTKVASEVPDQVEGKDFAVVLTGLGASSVDWAVRVWVKSDQYWPTRERLNAESYKALGEAGIGIPFPQMDIHLDEAVVQRLGKAA